MRTVTRVAIVTGAASRRGIGRATALALAGSGFHVAVLDLEQRAVEEAADALRPAARGEVLPVVCDVTDREQVRHAVEHVNGELGRVDALVNNAGITAPTRLEDIDESEWDRLFAVNVKGVFFATQAVLPLMRQNGYGRVVTVSSVSALRGGGIFGGAHYSATKAAVLGLAKAVARDMGPYGITSNAVAPGLIDTDITGDALSAEDKRSIASEIPSRRLGTAADVAAVIAFLCSEESAYVTGEVVDINGGSHID
jgi:NAD(P)-dependent dehydrogenase (short-subunit alcohol dehydrogenase family)